MTHDEISSELFEMRWGGMGSDMLYYSGSQVITQLTSRLSNCRIEIHTRRSAPHRITVESRDRRKPKLTYK